MYILDMLVKKLTKIYLGLHYDILLALVIFLFGFLPLFIFFLPLHLLLACIIDLPLQKHHSS